jgi:hypothetical protein
VVGILTLGLLWLIPWALGCLLRRSARTVKPACIPATTTNGDAAAPVGAPASDGNGARSDRDAQHRIRN